MRLCNVSKQAFSILIGKKRTTMRHAFLPPMSALALIWMCSSPAPSVAQTPADDAANAAWQAGMILHMQRMRAFHDVDTGTQSTPPVIGQNTTDADPSGTISTYQPGGNTQTPAVRFFKTLARMDAPASRATSRKPAGRSAPKACKTDLSRAPAPTQYFAGRWCYVSHGRRLDP